MSPSTIGNFFIGVLIFGALLITFTNILQFFPWYASLNYKASVMALQVGEEGKFTSEIQQQFWNSVKDIPVYQQSNIKLSIIPSKDRYNRGETFKIRITASYPFMIKIAGMKMPAPLGPFNIEQPGISLKYFK